MRVRIPLGGLVLYTQHRYNSPSAMSTGRMTDDLEVTYKGVRIRTEFGLWGFRAILPEHDRVFSHNSSRNMARREAHKWINERLDPEEED